MKLTNCVISDITFLKNLLSKYTNRAFFVGGCVRDNLLGVTPRDYDIEIYDLSSIEFETLMSSIGAIGVGKSFFVYKYKNIDLSLPRIEEKTSFGHRGFSVNITSDLTLAAKRRDFTINSIMENIFTGEIIDNFNGIEDLKNKRLKHIDDDSFIEDSLRVLRAVGFASRFGFKLDPKTEEICKNLDISDLSNSRIVNELEKIFCGKFSHFALFYLLRLGLFKKLLGFGLVKSDFYKFCFIINRETKSVLPNNHKFLFLYILAFVSKKDPKYFLDKMKLKKEYYHFFKYQPILKDEDNSFLVEISINMPLKEWIGLDLFKKRSFACRYKILDKKYIPKINGNDLLSEGFRSKDLGLELKRRLKEEIKKYMNSSWILLIKSKDRPGLVYNVSKILYEAQLNIEENHEYVDNDNNLFFMRTKVSGVVNGDILVEKIRAKLPEAIVELKEVRKKDVVVLVTKEPHCIGDLLVRHQYGELNANIKAVVGNYDVLQPLCEKFDIPFINISHEGLSREEHELKMLEVIKSFSPEYLVLAKYMRILSGNFVKHFEQKIINIHHSFLPAFIGANPYKQAWERGVKIIGATAHFVNNDLDEGPIVSQNVIPVSHSHSYQDMARSGRNVEKIVLSNALKLVFEDRVFVYKNKTVIFD